MPAEPFPGQIRTDARGRCPDADLVPLKGGCWHKLDKAPKDCTETEYGFVHKDGCYTPAYRYRSRPATSSPPEDGG
jgi:hypothetical protein